MIEHSNKWRVCVYSASTLVCLLCASITVFPLYTGEFGKSLGYSTLEINAVSIAAEIGLYAIVPYLGYLADTYRLSNLGALGAVLFLIGYLGAGWTFANHASYIYMALSFALIGVATSACYISALVSCTRLYPKLSVLAISVPTTAYGLSSLLYSSLISWALGTGENTDSAVVRVFNILGVVLFILGVLAWALPRLAHIDVVPSPVLESDEAPVSHFHRFVNDREPWILLISFVLVSGPLEMYLNNLGLIGDKIKPHPKTSTQVNLFSLTSTLSRLLMGAHADLYGHHISPSTMLVFVCGVLAANQVAIASGWFGSWFAISSLINGFGYGTVFTLYPILVTKVWGLDGFATYWGMFILGPAIGLIVFGVEFAMTYQTFGLKAIFYTTAVAMLASSTIVYSLAREWSKRIKLH